MVVDTAGEEEVIGNVALGYLETGVTPIEMAGYYQIFATGGVYVAAKAVMKIELEDGSAYYTRQKEEKRAISPQTADVMNKLLQGVVEYGGTGVAAYRENIPVAGKTGTGDGLESNWFVGVTPSYSCAIWHGEYESNYAAEMFGVLVDNLYRLNQDAGREFVTHENLRQIVYCTRSGKPFSAGCTQIDMGYYGGGQNLSPCDICGKEKIGG